MYGGLLTGYKVHHITNLIATSDGQGVLDGYLNFGKKVAKYLNLVESLEKAIDHLNLTWIE
jgi:hypothetical protein